MSTAATTPNSLASVSSTPYFGKAWKLELVLSSGAVITAGCQDFDPNSESLKVSFETSVTCKVSKSAYAFADISIYNLNQSTQQALLGANGQPWNGNDPIQQANIVSLFAGYQSNFNAQPLPLSFTGQGFQPVNSGKTVPAASSSLIWTGQVYQPLWERINVTDYKITLHCMIGYVEDATNFVAMPIQANSSQINILQQLAAGATNGIHIDNIDDLMNSQQANQQLPRGAIVFGRPGDILGAIAQTNYKTYFIGPNGINVRSLEPSDASAPPDWVFGPAWPQYLKVQPQHPLQYTPTLIGSPQQTQDGVVFRVQMDSRPKLADTVALDLSALNQLPQYPLTGQYRAFIDQNFTYVICGIRHVGDTRGNDWYTEITGVSKTFWPVYSQQLQLLAQPATN